MSKKRRGGHHTEQAASSLQRERIRDAQARSREERKNTPDSIARQKVNDIIRRGVIRGETTKAIIMRILICREAKPYLDLINMHIVEEVKEKNLEQVLRKRIEDARKLVVAPEEYPDAEFEI